MTGASVAGDSPMAMLPAAARAAHRGWPGAKPAISPGLNADGDGVTPCAPNHTLASLPCSA
jgi:hypothetical protein